MKNKIRKVLGVILLLFATQLPTLVGKDFWLVDSGVPQYFYLAKYVLECLIWLALIIYLIWLIRGFVVVIGGIL